MFHSIMVLVIVNVCQDLSLIAVSVVFSRTYEHRVQENSKRRVYQNIIVLDRYKNEKENDSYTSLLLDVSDLLTK